MTAALIAPADLSAYEFDIPCEWPGCDESAYVMSKGCGDEHHWAICAWHQGLSRKLFYQVGGACICNRLRTNYETHFDIQAI